MIIEADSVLNCLNLILFEQVFQIFHYNVWILQFFFTVRSIQSPFILRIDSALYSLVDDPLGVPDRGEVGDGVEAVTVSVRGVRHVDKSWVETGGAVLHDGPSLLPRHPQLTLHPAPLPARGQLRPRLDGEESLQVSAISLSDSKLCTPLTVRVCPS